MKVMYVLLTMQPTHAILRDKRYFLYLTLTKTNVRTISGIANLIEGSRRANIMLSNGTRFHINDELYSRKTIMNLLSIKDIHTNGFYIETMNEGNIECLYNTSIIYGHKLIIEKLSGFFSRLYHKNIKSIELYAVVNQKFNDAKTFVL